MDCAVSFYRVRRQIRLLRRALTFKCEHGLRAAVALKWSKLITLNGAAAVRYLHKRQLRREYRRWRRRRRRYL